MDRPPAGLRGRRERAGAEVAARGVRAAASLRCLRRAGSRAAAVGRLRVCEARAEVQHPLRAGFTCFSVFVFLRCVDVGAVTALGCALGPCGRIRWTPPSRCVVSIVGSGIAGCEVANLQAKLLSKLDLSCLSAPKNPFLAL